jgi:hypothetical protein
MSLTIRQLYLGSHLTVSLLGSRDDTDALNDYESNTESICGDYLEYGEMKEVGMG